MACHNGLATPSGEDISIGVDWRASMMGNAARDPYWMAGVRRETIDHPTATKLIEDECTICHMPMMRYEAKLAGGEGEPFAHLPPNPDKLGIAWRATAFRARCATRSRPRARDTGQFRGRLQDRREDARRPAHEYGPFDIDKGHTTIMRSSSTFQPTEGKQASSRRNCAPPATRCSPRRWTRGKMIGELAGAGALSGVAAQRLQGKPRAASPAICRWCRRKCRSPGVRRAARGIFAAHVRRRAISSCSAC